MTRSLDAAAALWHNTACLSPTLRVLLAGSLFATAGALIKFCAFPSLQSAALRGGIAAITLFLLLPEARRLPPLRVWLLLPAHFAATSLFVIANTLTFSASAIFLQSTAPLWIALLAPMVLRERSLSRDRWTLVGIGLGMLCCFLAPREHAATAPNPPLGDWLAVISGVGYALLLLGMRAGAQSGTAGQISAWGNLCNLPICLLLMPFFAQSPMVGGGQDWLVVSLLGVFQVGCAYALLTRAFLSLPVVQVSLLLMIEPALNPVFAWLAHGEVPHWLVWLGGTLIVGAVAYRSVRVSAAQSAA